MGVATIFKNVPADRVEFGSRSIFDPEGRIILKSRTLSLILKTCFFSI